MIKNCAKTAEILPSVDEILNKAEDVCPVQWAVSVAEKAMRESCGKGTFCRDGLKQLYLIGKDITLDKGTMEDIELLQELCGTMLIAADCELSGKCVELYKASLDNHYNDWTAHVLRHRCKAGACAGMKSGGAGASGAGIHINIPTGSAEGYEQVALQHTSAFDLGPKPLARKKKNRPHLCQPEKPIDPNAPEIVTQEGGNTVVRKDGRVIRRYRTQTGIISQD
jgi:hypothetical protein